ncbi:MFS transporter [Fulvivirga sediminis]|uniref:MFS transporter n=1 Tax=Fulvivirga sediminis TaxID=2803949 RepID=A0A937F2N1_9BACT|nr:MFS transporter [Fulvivirga sediminis]MBL3655176.1 MFS transporter [Fulvivirga sediminis]
MATSTGLVVANNYYNQPLLGEMARSFQVAESEVSLIPMLTQIGYAVGLFLIVPLGDKFERKKLILSDFIFIIASLLAAAVAQNLFTLMISSFFIGLSSVLPQLFVPMAAQLSSNEKRGASIGTMMTGMLIGILGSRTISGFVGAHLGWRSMYFIAAGMMVLLWILLKIKLPTLKPEFSGNYAQLLKSIVYQFKTRPRLRIAALRGAFDFASFSIFWTTLVFLLEEEPFNMGSDAAGSFGFAGIVGAIAASYVGRLADKYDKSKIVIASVIIIAISWLILGFSHASILGLIIGAVLLDLGVQAVHITNQTIIFAGNPPERNRINTVYMVMYFVGGATGTLIGGLAWTHFQWIGVCVAGGAFGLLVLIVHLGFGRSLK